VESIGATARASGLTVSALRFYDGAGVLVPAHVDPRSGYRSYTPDQVAVARLVAVLRRTGMPLAAIREVVAHRHDPAGVAALLSAHLRELERGVADARRLLARVPSLLEESPVTPSPCPCVLTDLPRVLRAVRFATGTDPAFPVLTGVLLDVADGTLTAVATDRYRMAVASAPATGTASVVVPAELADRLAALDGEVELTVADGRVTARGGATTVEGPVLDGAFPDLATRFVPAAAVTPVTIGVPALRAAVAAGGARTVRRETDGADVAVTVLSVDGAGRLVVDAGRPGIGLDVEFLLQAVDAGGPGQLVLDLDGPLAPVRIRPADRDDAFSLLMPVRL
jgi:DNA-binding transcriptional MerR regulator